MTQFIVVGADETVENVDIRGVLRTPGEVVELEHEDAQPLVDAGVLKPHDGGDDDLAKTDEAKGGDENTAGAGENAVAGATDEAVETGATASTEQA